PEDWLRVISVDLNGAFFVTQQALSHIKKSDAGRIVFISSIAGIRVSGFGGASYTAAKAGILGLMRHLATEAAGDDVTVNAVLPGGVKTPLVTRLSHGMSDAIVFKDVPLGRGALPREIGDLVAFLAGPKAGYITGAEFVIDGGRSVLQGTATHG